MNSKIHIILPIVLALLLPGLGLYSNSGSGLFQNLGFYAGWLFASLVLYLMWHALWHIWEIKPVYRIAYFVAVQAGFITISFGTIYFFVHQDIDQFEWHYVARITVASGLFLAIQYALKTEQHISHLRLEKEQIQTENYRAQLKALRAQVDPHFLFNSLNTLRSMVRQQHPNSESFIMSLSDFYRQTLKHNQNTTLRLSEELTVLESYLFLMKSRNEEAVSVNLALDSALHDQRLPTLALQVVVENCFKHNSMTSKQPLHIDITNTADGYISVCNTRQPKLGDPGGSGFGLASLRKRYELMGVDSGLIVRETPDRFCVQLKLLEE